ncbi:hypothetical protein MJO28_011403 [Puccinia striiformis f. sp. tritici]|uniref:Uncharacterized protein n=1 Tax=Puccinia striiformis f. sp. tritici TaxID=168172 RepID=A0ACC0E219_9BASI|nr:hypothetical protein MJO28_011403 [Puccinia striiformis f. sp. tritici]
MASLSDIQAMYSAVLAQQEEKLEANLAARDDVNKKLTEQVNLQDTSPKTGKKKADGQKVQPGLSQLNHTPINKGKASTFQGLGTPKSPTPAKSNCPAPTPSSNKKTPSSQSKLATTLDTKSNPPKPMIMITANMPEAFALTRDALYAHIKIIWNLLEQKTIPSPPHPNILTEFNGQFSDLSEIVLAADDTQSPSLIPVKEIVSLKSPKLGQRKIGQGMVHLEEFFGEYTQATLAHLGLRVWAPDLDNSPHSLYNKACRQAALKAFRQAAASFAYAYMNINKKYARDLELLIPAYNHFVHHLIKTQYKKEKKEAGKYCVEEEHKVIGRARDRLWDCHFKYALDNHLPKKY